MPECHHSWATPGQSSAVAHCFEDWQGLVAGLIQCQHCGAPAIFRLLAWRGARLNERIYSVAPLPIAATEVFLRNMQSAYCDLTRQQHEVEALTQLGEVTGIGVFAVPGLLCQAYIQTNERPAYLPWQDLSDHDPTWWSRFIL